MYSDTLVQIQLSVIDITIHAQWECVNTEVCLLLHSWMKVCTASYTAKGYSIWLTHSLYLHYVIIPKCSLLYKIETPICKISAWLRRCKTLLLYASYSLLQPLWVLRYVAEYWPGLLIQWSDSDFILVDTLASESCFREGPGNNRMFFFLNCNLVYNAWAPSFSSQVQWSLLLFLWYNWTPMQS